MSERNYGLHSLLGAAGGLAGLIAMRYAAQGTSEVMERIERRRQATKGDGPASKMKRKLASQDRGRLRRGSGQGQSRGNGDARKSMSVVGEHRRAGESAPAALGRMAHQKLTGKEPAPERKEQLSYAIHWAHGIAMGALYGAVRGGGQRSDIAGGALFGLGLWALGDELAVPLLGLGDKPTAYPLKGHIAPLVGHIAYGAATAAATHALSRLVDKSR